MVCSVVVLLLTSFTVFAEQPEITKKQELQLQASFYADGKHIYVQVDAERATSADDWNATLWASLIHSYNWGVGWAEMYFIEYVPIPSDTLRIRENSAELHLDLGLLDGDFVEHVPLFDEPTCGGSDLLPGRYIDLFWQFGDLHEGVGGILENRFWSHDRRRSWMIVKTLSERDAEPIGDMFGFASQNFSCGGLAVETRTTVIASPGTVPPDPEFPPDPSLPPEP